MILETKERLQYIIDEAWLILFNRIVSGKQLINKEASLQLQLARILQDLGNAYCILPNETFQLELETNYEKMNIDITCKMGNVTAAIELKCFRKSSNRAKDTDMYDVLKDIERLESFENFDIKTFICLTDNKYYSEYTPKGMASSVSLKHNTKYLANIPIVPLWTGKWNVNRDKPITFQKDVVCDWLNSSGWYYLKIDD